jgi:hypothetical protein
VPCAGFHRGPFGRLASQSSACQPVYLSYSNPLDTSGRSRPFRVVAPNLVAILAAARARFRPRPSAIDCAQPVRSVRLWPIGIVATSQPLALAALKPRPVRTAFLALRQMVLAAGRSILLRPPLA